MKIFKPFWVNHDGKKSFYSFVWSQLTKFSFLKIRDQPIFSLDVHPDSSRFATGGQGQDSGKIEDNSKIKIKNALLIFFFNLKIIIFYVT